MKLVCALFLLSAVYAARNDEMDKSEYTTKGHNKQVVCYWGTWANYRPNAGKFTPEDIDPSLCTNLIYSFAGLDADTSSIKSLDPWMDLEDNYGLAGFKKATDLKYANPDLKVTLAIGGWNEGSKKYSDMAKDPEKRQIFAKSAVAFLKKYNFDGLDLDWEYPAKRGGLDEDKQNFIELIKDLKAAFRPNNFLLTAAIGAAPSTIDVAYDVPMMYKYLDYVHIMCYDYHGKWDKKTGHNAPLKASPSEPAADAILNVKYTLDYLLKKGAKPEKTVLGVPLYGRAFMLNNPHDSRVGAKAKSEAFQGPYTREDGFLGYNEICEELQDQNKPWIVNWDEDQGVPYMNKELKWVSYDDERSIREKCQLATSHDLAGVMTWSIDTDDFRGSCGGPRFPLLRAINNVLYQNANGLAASAISMRSTFFGLMISTTLAFLLR